MEADSGRKIMELRVDGGAAVNNFLMQFQSDISAFPWCAHDTETTALGAAYLAGLAVGFWKGTTELESFWRSERVFEPSMADSTREALVNGLARGCHTLPVAPGILLLRRQLVERGLLHDTKG